MLGQSLLEEEDLATDLTLAAILSRVQSLVDLAGMGFAKDPATILAGKVLDLHMDNPDMIGQSLLVVGGMIALTTLELLFLGVRQDVFFPLLFCGLAHTTVWTHMILDASMTQQMIPELAVHVKTSVADVTGNWWRLARVFIHVLLEHRWITEYFVAFRTCMSTRLRL